MTPEEYERIRELFLAARDKGPRERAAFLRQACGDDEILRREIESLLASDEKADTFLHTPVLGEDFALLEPESLASASAPLQSFCSSRQGLRDSSPASSLPERIGQYRILDVLGEGGMGIVYRARQQNPPRIVALKVVKPGVESREILRRFEYECQVLGWLQHPGIAQVFEAGTADTGQGPQPFFAMELVQGQPLNRYADDQRLNVRQRLELLARVGDAVHHAHQKGVIHRDLKPANILVDETGQPKILDFGVARASDADIRSTTLQTDFGQLIGTMSYMSPEQVGGHSRELDIRSDIYTLGVIAYELLAGRAPVNISGKTIPQAAQAIAEEEPPSLSSVDRLFRGDVATIVARALEKDKNRRYQSASDLAADIRRYLADQPIAARPVTTIYQLRKFAKRNKALVAGVVVAFAALAWGFIQVTWERNRAITAERLAEKRLADVQREAQKVHTINAFLHSMLASVDPGNEGREVRVADVLDRAAVDIEGKLGGQPEIEASLRNTIGVTYGGLGLYPEAEEQLRHALGHRIARLGEDHPDTATTMSNLAAVLRELGKLDDAEALVRTTLEVRRRDLGEEHPQTLEAMNNLGDVLQRQGKVAEAETLWRDALSAQRRVLPLDDPQLPVTMNNLAQLLKQRGRPAEAEPLLREALSLQLKGEGEEHPHTLATMSNLAVTLKALGKSTEAESYLRRVVEVRKRTLGDHPYTFTALNNLAQLLRDEGRLAEAEPLLRENLASFQKTLGMENPRTLVSLCNLASLLVELGRAGEAEPRFVELLNATGRTLPKGHWMTLVFEGNYGQCLTALGRREEAEALLIPSYRGLRDSLGDEHEQTQKAKERLVELYEAWHKPQQADEYRR